MEKSSHLSSFSSRHPEEGGKGRRGGGKVASLPELSSLSSSSRAGLASFLPLNHFSLLFKERKAKKQDARERERASARTLGTCLDRPTFRRSLLTSSPQKTRSHCQFFFALRESSFRGTFPAPQHHHASLRNRPAGRLSAAGEPVPTLFSSSLSLSLSTLTEISIHSFGGSGGEE